MLCSGPCPAFRLSSGKVFLFFFYPKAAKVAHPFCHGSTILRVPLKAASQMQYTNTHQGGGEGGRGSVCLIKVGLRTHPQYCESAAHTL